jgi:hypothetical protein
MHTLWLPILLIVIGYRIYTKSRPDRAEVVVFRVFASILIFLGLYSLFLVIQNIWALSKFVK